MRWDGVCASFAKIAEVRVSSVLSNSADYEETDANSKLRIQTAQSLEWCLEKGLVGWMIVEKGFYHPRISILYGNEYAILTASLNPYRNIYQHVITNTNKPMSYPHSRIRLWHLNALCKSSNSLDQQTPPDNERLLRGHTRIFIISPIRQGHKEIALCRDLIGPKQGQCGGQCIEVQEPTMRDAVCRQMVKKSLNGVGCVFIMRRRRSLVGMVLFSGVCPSSTIREETLPKCWYGHNRE